MGIERFPADHLPLDILRVAGEIEAVVKGVLFQVRQHLDEKAAFIVDALPPSAAKPLVRVR